MGIDGTADRSDGCGSYANQTTMINTQGHGGSVPEGDAHGAWFA